MDNYLNKIFNKLKENIPNDVEVLKSDVEKNFQSAVNAKIKNLDLVTREEFDVQEEVLKRTRQKLDQLEKQLAIITKSN